jgi:hypothetical protein
MRIVTVDPGAAVRSDGLIDPDEMEAENASP